MALLYYTVTLGATATRAATSWTPVAFVRIESEASNAIVYYGSSTVSSADYGGSVLANTATITNAVTLGPFPQGLMDLQYLYFSGTQNQKIHVTAVQP